MSKNSKPSGAKPIIKEKYLSGKKLAFLGLGLENSALINYLLRKQSQALMTICDFRSLAELGAGVLNFKKKPNIHWRLGQEFNQRLFEFDILFRSPGWPIFCPGIQEALRQAPRPPLLTSPMKLFFALCPTRNIIGITGSKGKGTTSAWIVHLLRAAGRTVWLGGNIGVAPFEFLAKIKKSDWVVLELSSFQLQDFSARPRIGVITNFFSEHLAAADPNNPNYHRTLAEYWQSKYNLFRGQHRTDYAVVNKKLVKRWRKESYQGQVVFYDRLAWPIRLPGRHNQENLAAAAAVAKIAGLSEKEIKKAAASFRGLEHRLEYVGEIKGVKFYNDSFATTPESAITALRSFAKPIILLAGGAEKQSSFRSLALAVRKKAKAVILFKGSASPRLKKALIQADYHGSILTFGSMAAAVKSAFRRAQPGEIILLSPACASFGLFRNYKDRGKQFKQAAISLSNQGK